MTQDQPPSPDDAAERFLRELEEHFHGEKPPAIPDQIIHGGEDHALRGA
jgi:hypothetical protein